jgi:hypothetical protein
LTIDIPFLSLYKLGVTIMTRRNGLVLLVASLIGWCLHVSADPGEGGGSTTHTWAIVSPSHTQTEQIQPGSSLACVGTAGQLNYPYILKAKPTFGGPSWEQQANGVSDSNWQWGLSMPPPQGGWSLGGKTLQLFVNNASVDTVYFLVLE